MVIVDPARPSRVPAWTATGVAIAAAATAIAFGVLGAMDKSRVEAGTTSSQLTRREAEALGQQSNLRLSISLGAGIGAGASTALAAWLWAQE